MVSECHNTLPCCLIFPKYHLLCIAIVIANFDGKWKVKCLLWDSVQLCTECNNKLGIEAHEIFWQLLMERQFHKQIISALKQDVFSHDNSDTSHTLLYNK